MLIVFLLIHSEHQPIEFSYHVPSYYGGAKIILQNYKGEIENCRNAGLMSNILQSFTLKAYLYNTQKFELERLISECRYSLCEKHTKGNLILLSGKHQVISEKANRVKHSGKINLLNKWTNQGGWLHLCRRDALSITASGDFLGSSAHLCPLCYLGSFWIQFPWLAALDHPCFPAFPPCPYVWGPHAPHAQLHPHLQ